MNKFVIIIKNNLLTLSVIFLMLIARIFVFPVYSIDGASMDYTLQHNEKVMGIKMFDVERFDIVIVQVPEANKRYVKRVIGLPGDKIEYKNDQLFINGEFIEEAFLSEKKKNGTCLQMISLSKKSLMVSILLWGIIVEIL